MARDVAGIGLGLLVQGLQAVDPLQAAQNIAQGIAKDIAQGRGLPKSESPEQRGRKERLEKDRQERERRDEERRKEWRRRDAARAAGLRDLCDQLGNCLQATFAIAIIVLIFGLIGVIALFWLLWRIGLLLRVIVYVVIPTIGIWWLWKLMRKLWARQPRSDSIFDV